MANKSKLKVTMAQVLKGARHYMDNGQPSVAYPFVEALEKLAKDPVQTFKTQYWAGRALGQVREWLAAFEKKRVQVVEATGSKESELVKARLAKGNWSEDVKVTAPHLPAKVAEDLARLRQLTDKPDLDGYCIDHTDPAKMKEFQSALEEQAAVELEFDHLDEPFKLAESATVKGEYLQTSLNGEDALALGHLVAPPD